MEFSHGFLLHDSHEMMQAEVSGSDDFLDAWWFKIKCLHSDGKKNERNTIRRCIICNYKKKNTCKSNMNTDLGLILPPLSNFCHHFLNIFNLSNHTV